MSWTRTRMVVIAGAMLWCAAASAQTANTPASSQPAAAIQGKYEEIVVGGDAATRTKAVSTAVPARDRGANSAIDYQRVVLALGIVIGLILLMRWAGRRMFPGAVVPRSAGTMKVLSRLIISPKQQLLMIQIGRRIVVVGDSGGQMSPLSEITDAEETSSLIGQLAEERSQYSLKGFGSMFGRAKADFDELSEAAASDGTAPVSSDSPSGEEPDIGSAREEISGLADKIRLLSSHFRRSSP